MARIGKLNFSDIPEMLPGARCGANPAQREEFERRSRQLHQDEVEERTHEVAVSQAAAGVGVTSRELEEMFPMLDPGLVRSLRAEAPSAQHALETLIALAADTNEPVAGSVAEGTGAGEGAAKELPKLDLGVEDHDKFPCLIGADGWQVPAARLEARDEEPGSVWRDRAKVAAGKPAPKRSSQPAIAWGPRKKQGQQRGEDADERAQPLTDYECRHRAGERRAKQRVMYGRGGGRGGGILGRGRGSAGGGHSASESEEEEEEVDVSQV